MPRVSAIVPTFNRSGSLVEAIESALAQTYRDLEVIVVDDGSTDDTAERVAEISDDRVRYVCQERRGQPAATRNRGIGEARGELLAFLDDDDLWLEAKIERQVERLDAVPAAALCYTNAVRFSGDPSNRAARPVLAPGDGLDGPAFERLYGNPKLPNLTVMIRAAVLDEVGRFDEADAIRGCEDYELWLRVADRFELTYIDQVLALYRVAPGSISRSARFHEAELALVERLDERYPDFVASHAEARACWAARCHDRAGRQALRDGDLPRAREHLAAVRTLAPAPGATAAWAMTFLGEAAVRVLLEARDRTKDPGTYPG